MRLISALAFICLSLVSTTSLAQPDAACGEPPPVQDQTLKGEIDGKAKILSKFVGDAELKGKLEIDKKEILSKYPNADRALIDNRYYFTACSVLMRSGKSDDDKLRGLRQLRIEILGGGDTGKADDRATVRAFIQANGNFVRRSYSDAALRSCKYADITVKTVNFSLTPQRISIDQEQEFKTSECDNISHGSLSFAKFSFSANLSDLSTKFGTTSGGMMLYCTVGRCIEFSEKQEGGQFQRPPESGKSPGMVVLVNRESPNYRSFMQALDRIITAAQ